MRCSHLTGSILHHFGVLRLLKLWHNLCEKNCFGEVRLMHNVLVCMRNGLNHCWIKCVNKNICCFSFPLFFPIHCGCCFPFPGADVPRENYGLIIALLLHRENTSFTEYFWIYICLIFLHWNTSLQQLCRFRRNPRIHCSALLFCSERKKKFLFSYMHYEKDALRVPIHVGGERYSKHCGSKMIE